MSPESGHFVANATMPTVTDIDRLAGGSFYKIPL
jgi:hypothetical protein